MDANTTTPPTISVPPSAPVRVENRTWDVMCHLAALSAYIGVPFGHVVGPLMVWLIKRGDSPSVDQNGKEALNFQISLTLYYIAACVLVLGTIFSIVGLLVLPLILVAVGGMAVVLGILNLVFIIMAAVNAGDGKPYRYPLSIRLIS